MRTTNILLSESLLSEYVAVSSFSVHTEHVSISLPVPWEERYQMISRTGPPPRDRPRRRCRSHIHILHPLLGE